MYSGGEGEACVFSPFPISVRSRLRAFAGRLVPAASRACCPWAEISAQSCAPGSKSLTLVCSALANNSWITHSNMVQIFVRFGFCFWPLGSVQLKFNNAVRESSFRSLVGQRCWPSGLLASRPRDSGSCISIAEPML